jgi:K+-transporting ATPase ATPase C chain
MARLRSVFVVFVLLSVLTGVVYPLLVTALGRAFFPRQAAGSLIVRDGKVVGSALIGQSFQEPRYFWGRLSATSPMPNNGAGSSGSNLGPSNPALIDAAKARIEALKAADPDNALPIPVDLVTASASGLDPDITPAAALYQVARVARARALGVEAVRRLVKAHTEPPQWGVLGEARVNVLRLNLDLDRLGTPTVPQPTDRPPGRERAQ